MNTENYIVWLDVMYAQKLFTVNPKQGIYKN